MNGMHETADLLALDWGTSNLRAYAMAADGRLLAERSSGRGIAQLAQPGEAGFERALQEIAGDWLAARPGLPMVACGMVGSAQGWREAAYVPCPADVQMLAAHACRVNTAHGPLLIAPGLLHAPANAAPDVMRGEEIQIAGALAAGPAAADEAWLLLPGTHSKWAHVRQGRVLAFATYMTGELYAVLRRHSLLGRTMPAEPGPTDEQAFAAGLAQARQAGPGDLPHQLFATRTLGLTGRLGPQAQADYLSGLLIGHELVSGLARLRAQAGGATPPPLVLVGDPALLQRYAGALHALGHAPAALLGNSAPQGLFQFACAAGLLAGHAPLKAAP